MSKNISYFLGCKSRETERATFIIQENRQQRTQAQFQDSVFNRSRDRLQGIIEDEPELLDKILLMYHQGVFHKTAPNEVKITVDPEEFFHGAKLATVLSP